MQEACSVQYSSDIGKDAYRREKLGSVVECGDGSVTTPAACFRIRMKLAKTSLLQLSVMFWLSSQSTCGIKFAAAAPSWDADRQHRGEAFVRF